VRRRTFATLPLTAFAQSAVPTRFQVACMTLPYSAHPLERALTGIKAAGYEYVAWGVQHEKKPLLDVLAPETEAVRIARRCGDIGLRPIMMFTTVHLEAAGALDAHRRRIAQAAAAKIPYLLTFGKTGPGERDVFVENLRKMAPDAAAANVMVVIKQHGGNTATGADCARIVREVAAPSVRICYDAGNVLDYENHDPIADIATCAGDIRAFAIKDHRNWPKDEDCGPGFGEIDHYCLLRPVMRTGLEMPLACENIFEPLAPRPSTAEGIDALARRARAYVETVVRGLSTVI
jgi:sugar phosphate isomerase/epimerase